MSEHEDKLRPTYGQSLIDQMVQAVIGVCRRDTTKKERTKMALSRTTLENYMARLEGRWVRPPRPPRKSADIPSFKGFSIRHQCSGRYMVLGTRGEMKGLSFGTVDTLKEAETLGLVTLQRLKGDAA